MKTKTEHAAVLVKGKSLAKYLEPNYIFRGQAVHLVDGDTLDVELDVGFHAKRLERLRLARINTPELRDKNAAKRKKAQEAKHFVFEELLSSSLNIRVETRKSDSFGRYLAEVWYLKDDVWVNLNDKLLEKKFAVLYTRKRKRKKKGV